jgi:hypothetical protein
MITPYNMRSSIIICFLLSLSAVYTARSQKLFENDTVMALEYLEKRGEVYFSFEASVTEIRRLGKIISVDNYSEGVVFANANYPEFMAFLEEGLEFTVYSPPGEWYRTDKPDLKDAGDFLQYEEEPDASDWNYYPSYTEYLSLMRTWADNYPELCEYIDAGKSVEGRSILFIKITGNRVQEFPKPRFMYSSTMHGDETVGFVLMLRLIEYLLENYPDDPKVNSLLDNVEVWINPLANPDGAYFGGDTNMIDSPKRRNANNIDLNRNFPSLDDPDYTTQGRQPETAVMMGIMESDLFILSANIHGGVEVMNYPWDYWKRGHADSLWFEYICREYADTAILYSPSGYMTFLGGVTNGYAWYDVDGGRQDYVTYFTGGREITMEISNIKHPAANRLTDYWNYNRRSLLNFMEQAIFGINGRVTDEVTGETIQARVEVMSHDIDSSVVYSDESDGWYYRLLEQGNYDLKVSADGYYSRFFNDVEVRRRRTTRLDIELEPVSVHAAFATSNNDDFISIWPSPAGNTINLKIVIPESSILGIALYDQAGRQVRQLHTRWTEKGTYYLTFDVSKISSGAYILRINYGSSFTSRNIIIAGR